MIDANILALCVLGGYIGRVWWISRNPVDAWMAAFAGAMILLNLYVLTP
jgi:hypothetical protein